MNPSRRQARQLEPGDRFLVPVKLAFEIREAHSADEVVQLTVIPAACGPSCPDGCACDSSLLDGQAGPFRLSMDGKRKLEYLGNLTELLATLERTRAHIEQLQTKESGQQGGGQPAPRTQRAAS